MTVEIPLMKVRQLAQVTNVPPLLPRCVDALAIPVTAQAGAAATPTPTVTSEATPVRSYGGSTGRRAKRRYVDFPLGCRFSRRDLEETSGTTQQQ